MVISSTGGYIVAVARPGLGVVLGWVIPPITAFNAVSIGKELPFFFHAPSIYLPVWYFGRDLLSEDMPTAFENYDIISHLFACLSQNQFREGPLVSPSRMYVGSVAYHAGV